MAERDTVVERIGFIGLGAMGAPMLKRLARAAEAAFGFDSDQDRAARVCAEAGATACASIGEIAGRADILFTCLPNNDVVRTVYSGDGGIADAMRPGSITIDCSTVGPDATADVCSVMLDREVHHLDASMLGSVQQAEEGTISFVVGGDEAAFQRALPALEAVGGLIRHCGPSGSGNTMKLLHQTLVAGHAVAVAEALALADSAGVDLDAFYEVVTQGTGFAYSRYFEKRVPRIRSGDFSPLFMLKFMAKDARLARAILGDRADTASLLPMLSAVIDTLEEGEAGGLGAEDFSAAAAVVRRRFEAGSG